VPSRWTAFESAWAGSEFRTRVAAAGGAGGEAGCAAADGGRARSRECEKPPRERKKPDRRSTREGPLT
jgi:hypothetical protein